MSIILDALKKLDRERSARHDGPPNIGAEILRPGPPLRGKRTQLYFATVFLTAVAAVVITYAVVVWLGFPSKSSPPASVSSSAPKQPVEPASPEVSPPKPLPPASMTTPAPKQPVKPAPPEANSPPKPFPSASVTTPAPKQPVESAPPGASPPPKALPPASKDSSAPGQPVIPDPPSQEPARASGQETSQESSKIQNPPENKAPATPPGEKKEGQNAISEEADAAPGNKGKGVGPIPSGSAMSPLPLRITAIGWDENPSERFAFVNGMMVHEGDIIDEAKIVEIYPKRIRFLHNGQYFEIGM